MFVVNVMLVQEDKHRKCHARTGSFVHGARVVLALLLSIIWGICVALCDRFAISMSRR